MEEGSSETVVIALKNGVELECSISVMREHSGYFSAMLNSGLSESFSRRIEIVQLDVDAVQTIIDILEQRETVSLLCDARALQEALDYLQIDPMTALTAEALQIRANPGVIRTTCIELGWIDGATNKVVTIPVGKKKSRCRFWLFYLLCLEELCPTGNERIDQTILTDKLNELGNGVTLRRELIEYGLLHREEGGSDYWRPVYDFNFIRQSLQTKPRKIV
jgi:hypothetical protein